MTEPAQDGFDRVAVRRNVQRLLVFAVGLCLLGATAGVLVGVLGGGPNGGRAHHPFRAALLIVGPVVLGAGVMAAVLVVFLRQPVYRRVLQYGFGERRRVWKAAKAGRPLSAREAEVAGASRDHLRRFGWVVWVGGLLSVLGWVLQGIDHHGPGRWLRLAAAAAYVMLLAVVTWQWRRNADRYDQALSRPSTPEDS